MSDCLVNSDCTALLVQQAFSIGADPDLPDISQSQKLNSGLGLARSRRVLSSYGHLLEQFVPRLMPHSVIDVLCTCN